MGCGGDGTGYRHNNTCTGDREMIFVMLNGYYADIKRSRSTMHSHIMVMTILEIRLSKVNLRVVSA